MIISTQEYVVSRWWKLFQSTIPATDLALLSAVVDAFAYDGLTTIERGFDFIQRNPQLMRYEKNQIGCGEFALFLLFPDAEKVVADKGDIRVLNRTYEVKKIKSRREAIRFGTNIDLKSVSEFRLVTYGFRRINGDYERYSGSAMDSFRARYMNIMGGSDASIGLPKMVLLYELFHDVLTHYRDVVHCPYVVWLLNPFLTLYPTADEFGNKVIEELTAVYNKAGIDILIINHENTFLVNPGFVYHSINQTVRPQFVLK